jgi:hypothetical protein
MRQSNVGGGVREPVRVRKLDSANPGSVDFALVTFLDTNSLYLLCSQAPQLRAFSA